MIDRYYLSDKIIVHEELMEIYRGRNDWPRDSIYHFKGCLRMKLTKTRSERSLLSHLYQGGMLTGPCNSYGSLAPAPHLYRLATLRGPCFGWCHSARQSAVLLEEVETWLDSITEKRGNEKMTKGTKIALGIVAILAGLAVLGLVMGMLYSNGVVG